MRLGDIIDTLAVFPQDALIRFDFGPPVGEFASWRGRYNELTLTHGKAERRVSALLADARKADGGTFQGYKGGDYTMNRNTPVWGDDWGDFASIAVVGAFIVDGEVVLSTMRISEYIA